MAARKNIDWPAVFATHPGLYCAAMAREVGVCEKAVRDAADRHGVVLPLCPSRAGGTLARISRADLAHAAAIGMSANQFCIAHARSFAALELAERRFGMRLKRTGRPGGHRRW